MKLNNNEWRTLVNDLETPEPDYDDNPKLTKLLREEDNDKTLHESN